MGFAEPASIARSFAARDRVSWDPSRELVSQGAANVAAGVTGGFPVGGSFSRSALSRLAGARTRWAGALTGLTVLALFPFVGLLSDLPRSALAAIVIVAVVPLASLAPAARLWRHSRPAALLAAGTFVATVLFEPRIERGVVVGIGLSVLLHLWRESRLEVRAWAEGETIHLRPPGVLWFATAQTLEDSLLDELARHPEATQLELDLDRIGRLDITAAESLRAVLDDARRAGVTVTVSGVRDRDRRLVDGIVLRGAGPRGPLR